MINFHILNQIKSHFRLIFGWLFLFCFVTFTYGQYDIPPKPKSDASLVFNYAKTNILSPQEFQALNQKLISYEAETSTQIVVIILDSLHGEDPNFLGANWLAKWGIGQAEADNGMVIIMSVGDRKIAIQNGYGLEEYMTDAKSRQVIDNFIIPYFKQGQYYEGFDHGLDAIFRVLDGKFVEEDNGFAKSDDEGGIWIFLMLMVGMFILFWIMGRNNKGGRGNSGRRGSLGDVIFTDFGRSTWTGRGGGFGGGFGGGLGGGGFGGFGGGMGGGGGASGSW